MPDGPHMNRYHAKRRKDFELRPMRSAPLGFSARFSTPKS